MTDRTQATVEDKIQSEEELAKQIAQGLAQRGGPVTDEDIRAFFPECAKFRTTVYGHVPANGVKLPHFLIGGPPSFFNFEPLSESDFARRYGLSSKAVLDIVGARFLRPRLFVERPQLWIGMDHLRDLIQESVAAGVRVRHYLQLRYPHFDERQDSRMRQVTKAMERVSSEGQRNLAERRHCQVGDLPRVLGIRWAYLDALAPDEADRATQLLTDRGLVDAEKHIANAKHRVASPLTAALGGEFYLTEDEIERDCVDGQLGSANRSQRDLAARILKKGTLELLQYVAERFTNNRPFDLPSEVSPDALLRMFQNNDLSNRRVMLAQLADSVADQIRGGSIREASTDELNRLYTDVKKEVESYQTRSRRALDAGVTLTVEYVLGGLDGSPAWIVLPLALCAADYLVGSFGETFGEFEYKVRFGSRHRLMRITNELTGANQSALPG